MNVLKTIAHNFLGFLPPKDNQDTQVEQKTLSIAPDRTPKTVLVSISHNLAEKNYEANIEKKLDLSVQNKDRLIDISIAFVHAVKKSPKFNEQAQIKIGFI